MDNKNLENYKRPNILICGYTGAGKSSIIQALLGKDLVPDNRIGHEANPMTQDYDRYENELIGIYDSKGLEPDKGEDEFIIMTEQFIREKQDCSKNVDDHIHIFWYVISAGVNRVTETDLKIIKTFPKESTIVIISQIDKDSRNKTVEAYKKRLINDGNVSENKIICATDIEGGRIGIKELYIKSLEILPEAYKKAFEEAQRIIMKKASVIKMLTLEQKKKCHAIIHTHAVACAGGNAVPVPGLGVAADIVAMTTMTMTLAAVFGADIPKEVAKGIAIAALKRTLLKQPIKTITKELSKFIPFIGQIVAPAISLTMIEAAGWTIANQLANGDY